MTETPKENAGADMLRLAVVDADDLAVLSAHLQDATLSPADVAYLPKTKRFALVVCRLDWIALGQGRMLRRRAGFHFERVERVQRIGFPPPGEAQDLQLLSVAFTPGSSPAGSVLLTFAGGPRIRLDVECLEAEMRDLGDGWAVTDCPHHRLDETVDGG